MVQLRTIICLSLGLFFWAITGLSQALAQVASGTFGYYLDALRFSQTTLGGTARMQGIAGAGVALGGDATHTNTNPAGLGFFRRSEFTLSPSLAFAQNEGTFLGQTKSTNLLTPQISQMATVFNLKKNDGDNPPKKWRSSALAIGVTRFNSFQEKFTYKGINTETSLTDAFVEEANGTPATALDIPTDQIFTRTELAYQAYLINPFDNNNSQYFTWARDTQGHLVAPIAQKGIVRTKGSQSMWNLSYGANYNDRLFIGASLSISFLRYFNQHTYNEDLQYRPNQLKDLVRFSLIDDLEMRGSGLQLNIGAILRANDWFRIGLHIATPTWYTLKESYATHIVSELNNLFIGGQRVNRTEVSIVPGDYTFNLSTPWRASMGMAFILNKDGFLSFDAEYVDYTAMRLGGRDKLLFDAENTTIQNLFRPVFNLRAGGEYRADKFRLRGGIAFEDAPFKDTPNIDRSMFIFTAGMGYRWSDIFVDIALTQRQQTGFFTPYTLSDRAEPVYNMKIQLWQAILTLGVVF